MKDIVVIDASALVAIALAEHAGAGVVDRIADREIVAPRLLEYELANASLQKLKRHPDREAQIRAGLQRVLSDEFAIFWSDIEHEGVVDLALESGLSAYDASYLWLALHLDAELITLDGRLATEWKARAAL